MGKQIVDGTVEAIYTKDFGEADQYGNQYAVNVKIAGEYYGLGKKKKPVANVKVGDSWHQLAEGDVVEAVSNSVERGGKTYNNIKVSDITVKSFGGGSTGGSVSSGNSTGNGNAGGSGGSRNQVNDDVQQSIMRQSAVNYASSIVAGTLTSKSDLDQAAQDVIRLADEYILPYTRDGLTPDELNRRENEKKNQQAAQAADNEDFDDDIPF